MKEEPRYEIRSSRVAPDADLALGYADNVDEVFVRREGLDELRRIDKLGRESCHGVIKTSSAFGGNVEKYDQGAQLTVAKVEDREPDAALVEHLGELDVGAARHPANVMEESAACGRCLSERAW